MNLEEYTNSSERSLNCWIHWMHRMVTSSRESSLVSALCCAVNYFSYIRLWLVNFLLL